VTVFARPLLLLLLGILLLKGILGLLCELFGLLVDEF